MAVSATNVYTGAGIAEDFENIIYDISPEETPCFQWRSAHQQVKLTTSGKLTN